MSTIYVCHECVMSSNTMEKCCNLHRQPHKSCLVKSTNSHYVQVLTMPYYRGNAFNEISFTLMYCTCQFMEKFSNRTENALSGKLDISMLLLKITIIILLTINFSLNDQGRI